MEGGTHLVSSVSLSQYPQASVWVPILRICLRVSTQQYSQFNTVLIILVPFFIVLERKSHPTGCTQIPSPKYTEQNSCQLHF